MLYNMVWGTLKTNKIVSKFVPGVNANYIHSVKIILKIFWECEKVAAFLVSIYDKFLSMFAIFFKIKSLQLRLQKYSHIH